MKNKKSIFWGLVFIMLASYLLLNHIGIVQLPISIVALFFSALLLIVSIRGFVKLDFFGGLIPLSLIYWINEDIIIKYTGMKNLDGLIVFVVALLLAIGLNLIFGEEKRKKEGKKYDEFIMATSEMSDGGIVNYEANFSTTTKYVDEPDFIKANLANNFGKLMVYFDNAQIRNGRAVINAESNFGELILYIPKTWNVDVAKETAFGVVQTWGTCSSEADAPHVLVTAESNFGRVVINYI